MNDAPYQIKRSLSVSIDHKYYFRLIDIETRKTIIAGYGNSPIAPEHLRKTQAKLNSRVMLDRWGVF